MKVTSVPVVPVKPDVTITLTHREFALLGLMIGRINISDVVAEINSSNTRETWQMDKTSSSEIDKLFAQFYNLACNYFQK